MDGNELAGSVSLNHVSRPSGEVTSSPGLEGLHMWPAPLLSAPPAADRAGFVVY